MIQTNTNRGDDLRSPVLSGHSAAAYIGVGLRTLQMLTAAGKIPRVQLSPRRIGYLRRDLDAYIDRQRTKA